MGGMIKTPAEVFSVGEMLEEELSARGWTLRRLAEEMDGEADFNFLTLMVLDLRRKDILLDVETAQKIGRALGTSSEFWLNIDSVWRTNDR
jgi:HTH-type transcriptional regulator/antitoxin HigA